MLTAIALDYGELPLTLIQEDLEDRIHQRRDALEVRFLFRQRPALLPIWHEGLLRLVPWGNRREESGFLPCTGWTRTASIEQGLWAESNAIEVEIPATLGDDNGVWFRIRQGIRGLLVVDETGQERVFVICQPASHYYEVMTRSEWMPCLIEEWI